MTHKQLVNPRFHFRFVTCEGKKKAVNTAEGVR